MRRELLDAVLDRLRRDARPDEPTDRVLLDRFARQRDEEAFAALVRRHGPRVLFVCKRILRHEQDAEDAFQATFLVLARKAAAVGWRDSVGNYLHEVASRLSGEARRRSARQAARDRLAVESPRPSHESASDLEAVCSVLDEELLRLPVPQRRALMACYFEGRTRGEAAEELGWSLRTLERRLHQGRELLRRRLALRGVTATAALIAAGLTRSEATAAVGASVASAVARHAVAFVGGKVGVSAGVVALAELGLAVKEGGTMTGARSVLAVGCLLLAGLVGVGVWGGGREAGRPGRDDKPTATADKAESRTDLERMRGNWKLIREERDGKELPADKVKNRGLRVVPNMLPKINNMRFTPRRDENDYGSNFRLHPEAELHQIDLTPVGDGGSPTGLGIYEFAGDLFFLCVADHPSGIDKHLPRPQEFRTAPGSRTTLYVFERGASALDLIQGEWELMDATVKSKGARLTVKGNHFSSPGIPGLRDGSFKLDPAAPPPAIDVQDQTPRNGKQPPPVPGIYDVLGDEMQLCLPAEGGKRPKEFTSLDPGTRFLLFRRVPGDVIDKAALLGTWEVVRQERDGQEVPRPKGFSHVIEFKVDQCLYLNVPHFYHLDATKSPKRIRLVGIVPGQPPPPYSGIYELDGDRLRICLADMDPKGDFNNPVVPTKWETAKDSKTTLYDLRRLADAKPR